MKNPDVALVIFQAQAAISKACEGRACLTECLRAIERAASVETAAAPLSSSGAKAAKRTPAEGAPPHGARPRVPVGALRTAWRAFASLSRSARGLFRRIWRGLSARLPSGARLAGNAIAAGAITLCVNCLSFRAVADVTVQWINSNSVVVSGTVEGGSGDTVIITNMMGSCTNCTAITPGEANRLGSNVLAAVDSCLLLSADIEADCGEIEIEVNPLLSDISEFRKFGPIASASSVSQVYPQLTNYMATVFNNQTELDRSYYSSQPATGTQRACLVGYNDGIYDYATQYVDSVLENVLFFKDDILNRNTSLKTSLTAVKSSVSSYMPFQECTPDGVDPVPGGGVSSGGGGGSTTNVFYCAWTDEQIMALLDYVNHIDSDLHNQKQLLETIKNNVASVTNKMDQYARQILAVYYTDYTHIPDANSLGDDWRTVYIDGQPTPWGYSPTNILQRIELLIYGMSGVGTNATDVTEATGVDPDEAETAGDDAKDAIDELSVGDSAASADVRSIMDALTSFFRTFNGLTGDRFSGQTVLGSYSIDIGNDHIDVPALVIDQESSNMANVVQSACRAFLTCVYLLFAVFCGWRFYVLFLGAVVKYAKWAQELLSSLFAD